MKRFKIITVVVTALFLLSSALLAMELVRQKNVATYIAFPLMKNDGTRISAAEGVGVYYSTMTASGVALTTSTVAGTLTEVTAGSGMYKLALSQAEMNNDYLVLTATSTTANAVPQTILIRTTVGNPHFNATTDDGGTINVTGGAIDNATTITTYTGNTPQTGDSYAIVNSGTYGNSALKDLIDIAQTDLDTPAQYKADVSNLLNALYFTTTTGTIDAESSTTAIVDKAFDGYATDYFNGMSIVFTSANNNGVEREVLGFSIVASSATFVVSTLPQSPSTAGTFIIKKAKTTTIYLGQ